MGEYRSSYNYMSHSDTVSMVCHTEQTIKTIFFRGEKFGATRRPDGTDYRPPALKIYQILLQEMGFGAIGDIEFIKNPTLTITRCFLADFAAVSDQYDGTPETAIF